jgi:hypothetical protein
MSDDKQAINLRIVTKAGDIKCMDIEEYVTGKTYFYIHEKGSSVKTIKRDVILGVYRFNGTHEWPVNLKVFREKSRDAYSR